LRRFFRLHDDLIMEGRASARPYESI